jgi:hypothetical protein
MFVARGSLTEMKVFEKLMTSLESKKVLFYFEAWRRKTFAVTGSVWHQAMPRTCCCHKS